MNNKILTKENFLNSQYLKIEVLNYEKKLLHRTRFIIEVCIDTDTYQVKKKFDEFKQLSQYLIRKYGFSDLVLSEGIINRTKKKMQACQKFLKKVSEIIRTIEKNNLNMKNEIRTCLFQFLTTQKQEKQQQQQDDQRDEDAKLGEGNSRRNSKQINLDKQIKAENKQYKIQSPKVDPEDERLERGASAEVLFKYKKYKTLPINECWAKINGQWNSYLIVLKEPLMILTRESTQKYIYLKGAKLEIKMQNYVRIEISHHADKNPVEIRLQELDPNDQNISLKDKQFYQIYLMVYTCIKDISQLQYKSNKRKLEAQIVGKICLSILGGVKFKKQKEKQRQNQYFIRLIHEEIIINSNYHTKNQQYHIQFFCPVLNPYGSIKIQIVKKNNNWIQKNFVGDVSLLCVQEIQMQQIYNCINSRNCKTYQLSMMRSIQKSDEDKQHLESQQVCTTQIQCEDVSSYRSYFTTNQKFDYEGQNIIMEYSRDEMRVNTNRMKRILYTIKNFTQELKDDLNFKHPFKGIIIYIVLLIVIIFFDWNNFFSYLLLLTFFVTLSFNDNIKQGCYEFLILTNLDKPYNILITECKRVNPLYRAPQVISKKEAEMKRFEEKFELKMRKKRNLYSKYKRLQQILFLIQFYLMETSGMIQKFKNLLTWNHHKKTQVFVFLLFVAWFFFTFFPIKPIILVAVILQIKKAIKFYQTLYTHNSAVIYEIFKITQNSDEKEFAEFKIYLIEPKRKFETLKHYFSTFQKKFIQNLENLLDLKINDSALLLNYHSIEEVQQFLCTYHKKLRIKAEYKYELNCDKSKDWFTDGSGIKRFQKYLYSYLYNIPSDRYLLQHRNLNKLRQLEE